jgi:hypothetical protein
MPGLYPKSRADVVAKRRERAQRVTIQDVLLSRLLTEDDQGYRSVTESAVVSARAVACVAGLDKFYRRPGMSSSNLFCKWSMMCSSTFRRHKRPS